jgi:uncharacterized repeat protein (TIGR02543 family)
MESRTLRCTSCGLIVDDHGDEHLITCKACGNQYLASDGLYLSLKTQKEIDRLKNVRIRLDEVKTFNDYTMIYTHAEAILQIIPDDVLGHYYYAYAAYFMHQRKPLEVFLNREVIEASQAHKEEILLHMGHYMDIKEYDAILKFTERHQKHLFKTVKEALQKRIALEDHYAVVKRDVFICHRSTDREITQSIVTKLEQDGYTCWVSERNLRPDDNENYWKNIEEAIEHCTVFLVVSSQAAMLSKDVQRELSYANKLQKRKLEFKIDDSVHTTLFKHSFDGIKWIDGKDDNAFLQLSNRLYGYIHVTDTEKLVSQSASNQFSSLYKKIEIALKTLKFKQAKTLLHELKALDEGHELVWLCELYIEHKLHDMKAVLTFFEQASKTQLERFKKSSSYLNYERLFPQSELNHRLSETYQKVVKKHRKQQVRLAIVSVVIAILLSVSSVVTYQNIEQTIQFELNQEIYTLNETLTESGYQNKAGSLNLPIPETQGYTFMGWYDNPNFEGNIVEAITPKLSVSRSYYAKWEVNLYTITWETLEGGDIEETKIAYLNTITLPTNPTKEGYTFSGWYQDSGLTTPFSSTKMPSQNITLYAKWTIQRFTVIYQDSDFNMISTDTYAYGTEKNSITIPNDPYKEGYTFTGWSIALPNSITTNLTLTATYTMNTYQLTFQTSGGSVVGPLSLNYQSSITLPSNPTKEGYTFSGWYKDSELTTPFSFTTMPSQDLTVYAKWSEVTSLLINFDSKGGTSVDTLEVEKGDYLQAPQVSREGYTLDGWYTSQNGGVTLDDKWSFINNSVQVELTLYAKWNINQYTVSFNTDGGTVIQPLTLDYHSVITLPEDPIKEGYTFENWYTFSLLGNVFNIETMPANNIELIAKWTINNYKINFDSNGGTVIDSIFFDYNNTITLPNNPIKENYKFIGWFMDLTIKLPFLETVMPSNDITLFAKWVKIYESYSFGGLENDMFNDMIQDSDENIIAVGSSISYELFENFDGEQDGLIVKFNENFEIIWYQNFSLGLNYNESFYSIIEDSNGDYILIGETSNYSGIALKISKEGTTIWYKEFNLYSFNSIIETKEGDFFLAGSKNIIDNLGITKQAYIKIDRNGILMFEKIFEDFGSIEEIKIDQYENIFIVGYINNQHYEGSVKKINKYGVVEWQNQTALGKNSFFYDFILYDNYIYVVGKSENKFLFSKINIVGVFIFQEIFGGSSENYLSEIILIENNLYLIGGSNSTDFWINKEYNDHDQVLIKAEIDGNIIDQKIFVNTESSEISNGVLKTKNNLLIFGYIDGKQDYTYALDSDKWNAYFRVIDIETELNQVIVTFEDFYFNSTQYSIVYNSAEILFPQKINKINKFFIGWYYDNYFLKKYNETDLIIQDTSLFAKWIIFEETTELFNGHLSGLDTIDFHTLDYDLDGDLDIVFSIAQGNYTYVKLLKNDNHEFVEELLITEYYSGGDLATLQIIDFDLDGNKEIVVSMSNNNYHKIMVFSLIENEFVGATIYEGHLPGTDVLETEFVDIDQNGFLDFVILLATGNYYNFKVFYN